MIHCDFKGGHWHFHGSNHWPTHSCGGRALENSRRSSSLSFFFESRGRNFRRARRFGSCATDTRPLNRTLIVWNITDSIDVWTKVSTALSVTWASGCSPTICTRSGRACCSENGRAWRRKKLCQPQLEKVRFVTRPPAELGEMSLQTDC
jgi:hypothetical protein